MTTLPEPIRPPRPRPEEDSAGRGDRRGGRPSFGRGGDRRGGGGGGRGGPRGGSRDRGPRR